MEEQISGTLIEVRSRVGADGILHIEGLHDIANKDVVITMLPVSQVDVRAELNLQSYAASTVGESVAKRMQEIGANCSRLPILDARNSDEILGYNEIGLPE